MFGDGDRALRGAGSGVDQAGWCERVEAGGGGEPAVDVDEEVGVGGGVEADFAVG